MENIAGGIKGSPLENLTYKFSKGEAGGASLTFQDGPLTSRPLPPGPKYAKIIKTGKGRYVKGDPGTLSLTSGAFPWCLTQILQRI